MPLVGIIQVQWQFERKGDAGSLATATLNCALQLLNHGIIYDMESKSTPAYPARGRKKRFKDARQDRLRNASAVVTVDDLYVACIRLGYDKMEKPARARFVRMRNRVHDEIRDDLGKRAWIALDPGFVVTGNPYRMMRPF